VQEIALELGVRYLVEGSVQRSGERVRVSAQLIDAASGAHLWAERYDRELQALFAVQDDVTRSIAAVLRVKLTGAENERSGGGVSVAIHDCLLRGLERFWVYTQEATAEARALFAKAVELGPGYAPAHAWLARSIVFRWTMLWESQPETLERAFEHARTAVSLDERLPLAHSVLGWVQLWRKQGEASITAGQQAVALDPNNADAHVFLSISLSAAGRAREALHYIEKGMRLNPHPSAFYQFARGYCYYVLENYDDAIAALKRGTELRGVFYPTHYYLCLIYTLLGHDEEARAERETLLALTGGRRPIAQEIELDQDQHLRTHALAQLAGLE
jgi:adenylate cyclase